MKYLLHLIILCVLVGMHGCGDRRADSVFAVADSLMKDKPDSALTLLNALYDSAAGKMSRRQKMRLELMRADAQNKAFVNFTTDSVMREVTAYYDAHGTAQERMRAHYLLGCTYRDMGDAPRALECFHDAVSFADTTSADCDFQRLSRIYGQMADLFHAQRSPQFEKEAELNAIHMAWKAKDTLAALNFYAHLAGVYRMTENLDSALYISQDACKLLKEYGFEKYAYGFLPSQIAIYLAKGNYAKAKKMTEIFERESGFFDEHGNISNGKEIYYYTKGLCNYGINRIDSALFWYKKLLNQANNIGHYENAYKGLIEVYHKLGMPDSVMKYAQLFANANDSACLISSAEEINRANALYNYNTSRRQADAMKQKAERYKHTIAIVCLLAFSAICLICYIIIKYRRKARRQFTELNNMYFDTLTKYNQSVKDLSMLQNDTDKYRNQKEKETEALRQTLAAYTKEDVEQAKWDAEQYMLHCDIVNELHCLADRGMPASVSNWSALTGLTSQHLVKFHQHLSAPQYALSEREIIVCILIKLKFMPSEMAILFDCSKQIITNIRTSINHKLFNQEGTKTLDYNLKSL